MAENECEEKKKAAASFPCEGKSEKSILSITFLGLGAWPYVGNKNFKFSGGKLSIKSTMFGKESELLKKYLCFVLMQ